jgi:hypothetical protein
MKKLLLITLLFLNFLAFSQKVVLCEDYDKTTGVPSGVNQNWDIKSTGSYVYVIYTQSKPITNKLTVYVDKKMKKANMQHIVQNILKPQADKIGRCSIISSQKAENIK